MADKNPKMLFPNEKALNISHEFQVPQNGIGHIQVRGLPDCGYIKVEYHFGVDCDFSWEPFVFCNKWLGLCYPSTNLMIPIPGRYRLILVSDEGEHIKDLSFFDNTQIQYRVVQTSHDISDYYGPCCKCCGDFNPEDPFDWGN